MPWHLAGKDRGGCTRGWRLRKASEPPQEGPGPRDESRPCSASPQPSPASMGHVGTGDTGDHNLPPHPWPHSGPGMPLQHCPGPLLIFLSGHKELWHTGSKSPAPGRNDVAYKGHYSSLIPRAVGNMLHQGWIKLFLELNPGPKPAEQQLRLPQGKGQELEWGLLTPYSGC